MAKKQNQVECERKKEATKNGNLGEKDKNKLSSVLMFHDKKKII